MPIFDKIVSTEMVIRCVDIWNGISLVYALLFQMKQSLSKPSTENERKYKSKLCCSGWSLRNCSKWLLGEPPTVSIVVNVFGPVRSSGCGVEHFSLKYFKLGDRLSNWAISSWSPRHSIIINFSNAVNSFDIVLNSSIFTNSQQLQFS